MKLVVDIGSKKISAGLFEGDRLVQTSQLKRPEDLLEFLKGKTIEQSLIAGDSKDLMTLLAAQGFACKALVPCRFQTISKR
jgi:hypothetical protein